MVCGIGLSQVIGSSTGSVMLGFCGTVPCPALTRSIVEGFECSTQPTFGVTAGLGVFHLYANYRSVRHVAMPTLNHQRLELATLDFIEKG